MKKVIIKHLQYLYVIYMYIIKKFSKGDGAIALYFLPIRPTYYSLFVEEILHRDFTYQVIINISNAS